MVELLLLLIKLKSQKLISLCYILRWLEKLKTRFKCKMRAITFFPIITDWTLQNTTHVFLKNLLCDINWAQVSFTETYDARYFFSNGISLAFSFTTARKYSRYIYSKQVSNLEPPCYKPGAWSNSLAYVVIVIYLFSPYLILICNNLQTTNHC